MTDPNYTHMAFVVDRSGSMHPIQDDMNGAIKQTLTEQDQMPGRLVVDICTFDSEIDFPYNDATASEVKGDIIEARGTTSLLDAIGLTVTRLGRKLSLMPEDHRPANVIVVVVTDGQENSSREYTREGIKAMVQEQTDRWGWNFLYLAANVDAFATGQGMGFGQKMSMGYAATAGGAQSAYDGISKSASRIRSGGSGAFTDEEREAAEQS